MTDAAFNAMCDRLELPAQRRARSRGTLALTWFMSCLVANGVKCTTHAQLTAITTKVRS